jgi:hypothetical protein
MPGPHQCVARTRVEHDVRPYPCGLLVRCNEPIRHERNLTWHALQLQQTLNLILPRSKHGTSPRTVTKASGPKSEQRGRTATAKVSRFALKSCRWTAILFFVSHCPKLTIKGRARKRLPWQSERKFTCLSSHGSTITLAVPLPVANPHTPISIRRQAFQ